MSHVTTSHILKHARINKYAVPCFLAGNIEMVIGQVNAAEKCGSPLIITYNHGLSGKVPIDIMIPLMVRIAKRAAVPVATILDHGSDLQIIKKSIALGISSVMFDGSSLPYDENVQMTREVVDFAKNFGVAVEAELGSVGGSALEVGGYSEVKGCYTDPNTVCDFINKTGIDQLAISVGNVHGAYQGKPEINFQLVEEIFDHTEIPLVLHGGSGLTEADYRRIIECGISKINYYSVMGISAMESLKDTIASSCPNAVFHHIIDWGIDFFEGFSEYIYQLFGCAGNAYGIPGSERDDKTSVLEVISQIAYESYIEISDQSKMKDR